MNLIKKFKDYLFDKTVKSSPDYFDSVYYLDNEEVQNIHNDAASSVLTLAGGTAANSPTYVSGYMGIGTTTPTYKLHVTGDIYANGGWMRVSGNNGLYFESWGGGWFMQDATWIRNYNNKQMYYNTAAGDNTTSCLFDQESATQDHSLTSENDAWGYVGFSNQRWWAMYAASGFGTSSVKYKSNIEHLTDLEINQALDDVNKIESIRYKWNKSIWEKENGNFVDNRLHKVGEKPDPNVEVPSWLGFSVESLPKNGIVDETGENYQYGAMFGLLIASTKALDKKIEEQGKEIEELKRLLNCK